jgi:transposase
MISDEQEAHIRRLFFAEHWKVGTIAAELGLHHDVVRRVVGTDAFVMRGCARPSALDPYVPFMRETLERYPKLTGTRLHEMVRLRGYEGSAVQVRRKIVALDLRPRKKPEAFLQLHTLPGEQGQVDWADFGMLRVGAGQRRLFAFVIVLSWSRAIWVYFSFDQTMSSVIRGHIACFEVFGGVPRTLVYDNMKTVVLERDGDAIRFHPRFLELRKHYHFAARPCRPRRANEKGRVERAIRYLRSSFFAGRHFADLRDVREQFEVWQREIAHARKCPQDENMTVAEALEAERPRLIQLPEHPIEGADVRPVIAKKQPYVTHDTNRYSIPWELVGVPLTLVANEDEVRVLDGVQVVARHARSWERKKEVEDPAHLRGLREHKERAAALSGRALVLDRVPEALALYEHLATTHERIAPHTNKLIKLLQTHGVEPVTLAVRESIERGTPRADSVAYVLEKRARRAGKPAVQPRWGRPEIDDLVVEQHDLEDYDD